MVSVDDLVISLKIEEGSNLSNLQKQLEALVGKKGEKADQITAGTSTDVKRDLSIIKTDLDYITSQTVPGRQSMEDLKESLRRDKSAIESKFTTVAEKLKSHNLQALQRQFAHYNIIGENKDEQLREELEGELTNFLNALDLGIEGGLPPNVMENLGLMAKKLLAEHELNEHARKTLVTGMHKAIGELNEMVHQLWKAMGIKHIPEFSYKRIREAWYTEKGYREHGDVFGEVTLLDKVMKEEIKPHFDKIKGYIRDKNLGIIGMLNKSIDALGIELKGEGMPEYADIKKDPRLMAIAYAMFRKQWGTQAGVPPGFGEAITDIVRLVGEVTGVKGLEKGLFKGTRPDFLILKNDVKDLKKFFSPEVAEKISKTHFVVGELKAVLEEGNIKQFKEYIETSGREFIVAIAGLAQSGFLSVFGDMMVQTADIVTKYRKFIPEQFGGEEEYDEDEDEEDDDDDWEEAKKLIEEDVEETADNVENLQDTLQSLQGVLDDFDEEVKDIKDEMKKADFSQAGAKMTDKDIDDILGNLDDIKATTDDTNKEVKKKRDEPKVEKDKGNEL